MDQTHQAILDTLPARRPAPALEPYRDLICEIRRRGWSYREIAQVLAERLNIEASLAAIHDIVRPRGKARRQHLPHAGAPMVPLPIPDPTGGVVRRRFEKAPDRQHPIFEYDENEPLRLISNSKRRE